MAGIRRARRDQRGPWVAGVGPGRARYWQAAVEPFWPRLRALSTADLTYRMEQFANGGLAA